MEYNELPVPVPAAEAIAASDVDIRVPNGSELTIGPFEREFARAFRLARVDTFKDLQTLGFVHREVREEQVTQAYRLDERAFRDATVGRFARAYSATAATQCGCGGDTDSPSPPPRRQFQNHLIDLLQPPITETLSPHHPVVVHAYRHVKSWLSLGPYLVGIFVPRDITIGDHATLTSTPTVKALYAHDITIGREGRLRFLSGSVKVRCRNLNGAPSNFVHKFVPGLAQEFVRRQ
jgi:hypothetical protein